MKERNNALINVLIIVTINALIALFLAYIAFIIGV
jgi:hypothetical protein